MNLSEFVNKLEKAGELIRIEADVTAHLEISEVADRFSGQSGGGKALLFERNGTDYPVLINALGSRDRIRIAFGGHSPDNLAVQMNSLLNQITGGTGGLAGKIAKLPLIGKAARWLPKRRLGRGKCQDIIQLNPDLAKLPILTCWPHDGGPFITLPLVHTADPISRAPNLGMYRMQVFDGKTTGMHWHMHKTGARHYRGYREAGRIMPVAVALGGDPVYTYCATAPLPDGIDEYLLAGFIRNKPVRMVKCVTQELWIPEDCDFVLEGYVDPEEPMVTEGPFGDHTGFYSLEDKFPVFHLTAITNRRGAIYPATIVGIPPQEDAWLAWATEQLFKPLIRLALIPELVDFHLPVEGVAHNLVLAKIRSSYPGQGRKVFHTLWGAGQMMFTKCTVITADGPDLTDYAGLIRYVSGRVDPFLHLEIATGPLDILDHSARVPSIGGKIGIDATGPEIFPNTIPLVKPNDLTLMSFLSRQPSITDLNLEWLAQGVSLGLLSIRKAYPQVVHELEEEIRFTEGLSDIRFWIIFNDWVNIRNPSEVAWLAGSNTEVLSDIHIYPPTKEQQSGILFIDATVKTFELDGFQRPWPNPTVMDAETIHLVDSKWADYRAGVFIPSRSEQYQSAYLPGAVRHKSVYAVDNQE